MPYLESLPGQATLADVFRRYPDVTAPLLALHEAIMRAPSPFSAAEREAIAAYVSSLNACQYCQGVHSNAAVALGAAADDVAAICALPEAPGDARLAPVLAYVAKLTTAPASVGRADVEKILAAGWDETAVSTAAFVAALYAFMNRMVEGHGLKGSDDYYAAGGKRLAEIGYAGLAELLAKSP
jgi:uncharacterized peroxidase-related enzyme